MIPKCLMHIRGLAELDEGMGYVYFLISDEKVLYVGKTFGIHGRIRTHRRSKKFDQVFYILVPKADLLKIEREWIHKLHPPLNMTENGGFDYCTNLRRQPRQQPYPYKIPPRSRGYAKLPVDILDPA